LPSLAYLVSVGELQHVDLVFPTVPRNSTANRIWVQWSRNHEDVLHATGNPTYTDYKVTGEQPLHLGLWFRSSAKPDVQQLIRVLEQVAKVAE
jgi:hypothetical protein